jgi:hypothetical protein
MPPIPTELMRRTELPLSASSLHYIRNRPLALHGRANDATLGRPIIHQTAARALAPFIMAYPVISFLRRRARGRSMFRSTPQKLT